MGEAICEVLNPVWGQNDANIPQQIQRRDVKVLIRVSLKQGGAERSGTVQPGEEKAQRESHHCV